ncbi:hypothetical protein ABPG74_003062 [Tetrahymena malaccensis]
MNFINDFDFTAGSIIESIATPLVMAGIQLGYDKLIDNYNIQQAGLDSLLMLGSLLASKFVSITIVKRTVRMFQSSQAGDLSARLTEPILNYFIYSYFYNTKFKPTQIGFKSKTEMEFFFIPVIQLVFQAAIDRYVVSWITGRKSHYDFDI